jgi:NAD(P)-dependent dehydrogenase (short-subunit alcohol dehydrogenase family)
MQQRTYAVTGAASGIGRATATMLAGKGARVFALDFNEEGLRALAAQGIATIQTDVTSAESVGAAAEAIRAGAEGLDGLVNCAGILVAGALVELPEADLRRIMDVNVMGAYRVTRALYPLLEPRRGRVVNVSSEAAYFSAPFNGPYSMSKYALEAYSDALRRELALKGMKVAIIQPGPVRTALLNHTVPEFDRVLAGTKFESAMRRIRDLSSREWDKGAEPEEVARAIWHALTARRPKIRYRVHNDLFRRVFSVLPDRWADSVLNRMLKG